MPRGRLDRRLAVLLLRSSYEVVDELDATPMDGFQRDFWLERQGTQQAYNDMYPGASASAFSRQGDLTDPLWFDFVCAAQSVVIERSFRASEAVFEEAQGADGTRAVVRRDPSLDRRRLAGAYAERLGARLVAALGPGGWDDNGEVALFGGPAPPARGADGAALLAGVRALAGTLVAHGYCFAASVEPAAAAAAEAAVAAPPGGPAPLSFALRLDGASNLYSAAARARASPPPALAEFAVAAFLRASGRDASWTWRVGPASLGSSWTVT